MIDLGIAACSPEWGFRHVTLMVCGCEFIWNALSGGLMRLTCCEQHQLPRKRVRGW